MRTLCGRFGRWAGHATVVALCLLLTIPTPAGGVVGGFIDFENLDAGTCVDNLCEFEGFSGIYFTSPRVTLSGYEPITTTSSTECLPSTCGDIVAKGGSVAANRGSGDASRGTISQVIVLNFDPAVEYVSFDLTDVDPPYPGIECGDAFGTATVRVFTPSEEGGLVFPIIGDGIGSTTEFFDYETPLLVERVEITSGDVCECEAACFPGSFGVDNIFYGDPPLSPPVCSRVIPVARGAESVFGLVETDPNSGGIASIGLLNASPSLSLTTSPADPTNQQDALFTVEFDGLVSQASGIVEAFDQAQQSCSMLVDFRGVEKGELIEELICEDPGAIELFISNEDFPGGRFECSFTELGPNDPPLPPAYDPVPDCQVTTIDSPNTGLTTITLKVTGTFDPDLRLLFSQFDGSSFGSWQDITEEVAEIIAIPDPTRMRGKSQWSIVKVSCAKLNIDCSDPSLNQRDDDGDGFVICNGNTPIDCNDQRDVVNPNADEICTNGLDDDCDGLVDDADDDCVPLFAQLDSLSAEAEEGGIRVRWSTSSEMDNIGFRVVRIGSRTKRVVANPQIIPAAGTETSGADYDYLDRGAPRRGAVRYYLEDIDSQGRVTRHGPVTVESREKAGSRP
jgi:hypothetical protein